MGTWISRFFLILALPLNHAHAGQQCAQMMARVFSRNSLESLEPQQGLSLKQYSHYRLFEEGPNQEIRLTRHALFEARQTPHDSKNAQGVYWFRTPEGKRIQILESTLRGGLAPDTPPPAPWVAVTQGLIDTQLLAQKLARIIFFPYKTRFEAEGIRIVGGRRLSPERIQAIGAQLLTFDRKLESLGLTRPKQTRVILADDPLPSLSGPCAQSSVLSFWDWRCYSTIDLTKVGSSQSKPDIAFTDPSVLYHERAHTVLFSSFLPDSILRDSETYQEAFADILAAHANDSPIIADGYPSPGKYLRSMSDRPTLPVTIEASDDAHENSGQISWLIWSIRESFAKQDPSGARFESFLRSLLTRIDGQGRAVRRLSWQSRRAPPSDKSRAHDFIYEFVYALIQIEQELNSLGMGALWQQLMATQPYLESRRALQQTHDRMRAFLQTLPASDPSQDKFFADSPVADIRAHALPGLLLVEGYLLYEILNGE